MSRLQLNPASLNLVRAELARLIKQAQTEFEARQQDAQHDLAACRGMLAQVDGVLRLVELGDAALLAHELGELLQAPPANARATETVTRAFFVLGRYLEYLAGRRHALPELLLEDINAVRALLQRAPLGEAHFANGGEDNGAHCPQSARAGAAIDDARLRRYRHMYQVGLLGVIKGRADAVHIGLMRQPVERILRLVGGGPAGDFWWLLDGVLEGFAAGELKPTALRCRLLSRADRMFRELQQRPSAQAMTDLDATTRAELLRLIARCANGARGAAIRAACGIVTPVIGDLQLADERKLLLGTSADSVDSMVRVLKGELHKAKDEVEQAAQSGALRAGGLPALLQTLENVSSVLRDGGLRSSADMLERQLGTLRDAATGGSMPSRETLVAVADSLVYVETTLNGLARAQGLARSMREQQQGTGSDGGARAALDEARVTLLHSAREAIECVKRAVTTYVENAHDPNALAGGSDELLAVKGALQILEHRAAAAAAERAAGALRAVVENGPGVAAEAFAESLADVLICLEYYLAALENGEEPDPLMLKLAEESLAQLGRSV